MLEHKSMRNTLRPGKPRRRMKTVVKYMRNCLHLTDCLSCAYAEYGEACQLILINDALYYLEQTLEKSEGKKDGK